MPHRVLVYPLGHAVEFESDQAQAIDAVLESWTAWPQLFDAPPLRFRVDRVEGPAAVGEPAFGDCGGTIHLACDESNQGSYSLETGAGWLRVSGGTLGERNWFRYHLLEALVLTALDAAFFMPVHAACLARHGREQNPPARMPALHAEACATSVPERERGLLLCGGSGAGKTTLAFAAARAGWTLVSEDGVHLAADDRMTGVGGAHTFRLRETARELFPELESRPASTTRNGKIAIAVEAGESRMSTAWSTDVAHSVFLLRRPGLASLNAFPPDHGLPYFLEWVRSPDRSTAVRRMRELLARGCWKLEYEEFPDALRLLEQLP